jgi:hypothetical protein
MSDIDFRQLAAKALGLENIQITNIPRVRATLFQGDHEITIGSAEVLDDRAMFFPNEPRVLETLMPAPISLKVSGTSPEVHLSQSKLDFEFSSRLIWFFDRATSK